MKKYRIYIDLYVENWWDKKKLKELKENLPKMFQVIDSTDKSASYVVNTRYKILKALNEYIKQNYNGVKMKYYGFNFEECCADDYPKYFRNEITSTSAIYSKFAVCVHYDNDAYRKAIEYAIGVNAKNGDVLVLSIEEAKSLIRQYYPDAHVKKLTPRELGNIRRNIGNNNLEVYRVQKVVC